MTFLASMEAAAVGWIRRSLQYFDPSLASNEAEALFARKALLELAILVACRVRLRGQPLESDYAALLDHVEVVSARPSYHHLVARDHRNFLLYGLTYAALKVCGRCVPEFRWIIDQLIDFRHPLVIERVPYRMLDLIYVFRLAGINYPEPTSEQVLPLTMLANCPNIVAVDDSDAYAITHAVLYLTDFGLGLVQWPPTFARDDAVECLEALTRHYRIHGNADLTAELAASLICLGAEESPEIGYALTFLHHVQRADGSLPGPPKAESRRKAPEPEAVAEPSAYLAWRASYHTTMVAVLAALIASGETQRKHPGATSSHQARTAVGIPMSAALTIRCRDAVTRGNAWLTKQALIVSQSLAHRLRAAAGLALGMSLTGITQETKDALGDLAANIARLAEDTALQNVCSADTLLLTGYVLSQADITCPRVTRELATIVSAVEGEDLAEIPAALPACAMLSRMGFLEPSKIHDALERAGPIAVDIPVGQAAPDFAFDILARTGGEPERLAGYSRESACSPWDHLSERMLYELVRSSQDYCLSDAAVILRMCVLLGKRQDRVARDAAGYFLSQQMEDGRFGYFVKDCSLPESDALHLTWTVAIMWALMDFAFPVETPTRLFTLPRR